MDKDEPDENDEIDPATNKKKSAKSILETAVTKVKTTKKEV
jgi:hypothetical protein